MSQDQLDATRKQHIQAISEFTGKEQQARRELEKVRHHVHDLALVQKEIWEELQHAAAGLNTDLQYVERMAAAERSQMQQQTRALQEACSREWLSMEQQRVVDTELLEKELAAAAQREKVLEDRLMAELKSREDERVRAAQERAQAQAAVQDERSFWAENKSRLESLVAIYKQAMSGLAAEVMDVAVDVGDWAESMRGGLAHGQAKLKTFSLFMHEVPHLAKTCMDSHYMCLDHDISLSLSLSLSVIIDNANTRGTDSMHTGLPGCRIGEHHSGSCRGSCRTAGARLFQEKSGDCTAHARRRCGAVRANGCGAH